MSASSGSEPESGQGKMGNVLSQDRKHANNEVCTCMFRLPYKDLLARCGGDVLPVFGVVLVVSEGVEVVGVPTGEEGGGSRDHHQTYL